MWEEFKVLKGKAFVEKKEEALRVAREWQDQSGTIWTDGPRLENGAVGAAVAFRDSRGWVKRGTYLGKNKEVFDAEVFATMWVVRLLDEREERGRDYTIFSDSQAAVSRVQHDRRGPAQALARVVIATVDNLTARDNTLIIRRTPAHAGIDGNEQADETAKLAVEGRGERVEQAYLQEASLTCLTRRTTETRSEATSEWIRTHVGRRRRYRPPPGGKLRKGLARVRKELAGRFYQLLLGYTAIVEHLVRVGQASSDRCWWCGSGERQTRFHLLVKCRRWEPEIRRLWKRVGRDCGWGGARAPSVRLLFKDVRATPAILEFLESTRVGKIPGRILMAGGPDFEEGELEEASLRVQGEEEGTELSESEEEDGSDPPP